MFYRNPMHPDRYQELYHRLTRGSVHPATTSAAKEWLGLFISIDPTSTGKYVRWLVKLHLAEMFEEEDAELYTELLEKFHRFKNQLPVSERDILKHTKGSLALALKGFEIPEGTRSQLNQQKIAQGLRIIHEDHDFQVLQVTTPEAARHIAKGTAWCVSSLKVGADYIATGPLILIRQILESGDYESVLLAHHGYKQRQSHPEADAIFEATSQVKDSTDEDYLTSPHAGTVGHELPDISAVQYYLQLGFAEARTHRMRKFSDAMDLKMYEEDIKEGRVFDPQTKPFDWATGKGQIEMDEEYLTRLIDMAANIFGGRDEWIEARILESGSQSLLLNYIMETHSIAEDLEKHLSENSVKLYIEWVFGELKLREAKENRSGRLPNRVSADYVQQFIDIATRVKNRGLRMQRPD